MAAVVAAVLSFVTGGSPARATGGDVGYLDQSYTGATHPPTSDKPQSKLWYNDGLWWATMFDTTSQDWHIFRLDRSTEHWVDTGTPVDTRPQTLSDALWDGNKLYIASQYATVSDDTTTRPSLVNRPARLYRYTYHSDTKTYTLDTGFPAAINNYSSESLTVDEDSTGRIWATWTQVSGSSTTGYANTVYVNSSADGSSWGTPMVLPVGGVNVAPDDISAVVAYGKSSSGNTSIGVLWSNHLDDTMYWAVHKDGDALTAWKGSVAIRGNKQADDHINLKTIQSDQAGRVFAAVKTSFDEITGAPSTSPQIQLLVYKPGTASWGVSTIGTLADCHTRPQVVLDETNAMVHVFATAPTASGCPKPGAAGSIYEKSAPLDSPVFPAGRGTPVIRDAASAHMNNVTATKQSVTSASGIVVLASNTSTKRYWHADISLGPTSTPTPTPTPTPTGGIVRAGTSTNAATTNATGLTVNAPQGTSSGDLLVSCLALRGGTVASTGAPAGWTPIAAVTGVTSPRVFGYYKVAGSSEPASYSWTFSSSTTSSGGIARYTGATGPDTAATTASGAAATSATVPGMSTTTTKDMLVGCMGINATSASVGITAPSGMSPAWDINGRRQQLSDAVLPAAGSTGDRTWTFSAGRAWAGWLVALRPQ